MIALLQAGSYVGFFTALSGALLFILIYGPLVRWWEKQFGIHLFAFMLVLAATMTHNAVRIFFPDYPGRWFVTFALMWAAAWVVWWRLVILVTVQLKKRNGRDDKASSTSEGSKDDAATTGDN